MHASVPQALGLLNAALVLGGTFALAYVSVFHRRELTRADRRALWAFLLGAGAWCVAYFVRTPGLTEHPVRFGILGSPLGLLTSAGLYWAGRAPLWRRRRGVRRWDALFALAWAGTLGASVFVLFRPSHARICLDPATGTLYLVAFCSLGVSLLAGARASRQLDRHGGLPTLMQVAGAGTVVYGWVQFFGGWLAYLPSELEAAAAGQTGITASSGSGPSLQPAARIHGLHRAAVRPVHEQELPPRGVATVRPGRSTPGLPSVM